MNTLSLKLGHCALRMPADRRDSHRACVSRSLVSAIALLCAVSAAACSSTDDAEVRPAHVADFSPVPVQVLQPGDELEIKFRYTPELDQREAIRPDGTISMPLMSAARSTRKGRSLRRPC
jgi:hypothetical protein